MSGKLEWELIGENPRVYRAYIPGGWLVRSEDDVFGIGMVIPYGRDWRSSLCFVPDPDHLWEV